MTYGRLSSFTAGFLALSAFIIDALQFAINLLVLIPAVGFILSIALNTMVSVITAMFFGIVFAHNGISLVRDYPREFLGALTGELTPIFNGIPAWFGFVLLVLWKERLSENDN